MTLFDVLTVVCFLGVVAVFFQFSDREPRTLVQLLLSGVVFAVANQLGNGGWILLGSILIVAGVGYTLLVVRG